MNRVNRIFSILALVALVTTAMPAAAASGKVNLNTASVQDLSLLPRVGPVVAQRIVDFRAANGEFTSTTDLMLVQGIGDKTFALLEDYISLAGETTLTEKVRASRKDPAPPVPAPAKTEEPGDG